MTVGERFLDLRKYGQLDDRALNEIAGVFVENRRTEDLGMRVKPFSLVFNSKGNPDFPIGLETRLKRAEAVGMRRMWRLANAGEKYVAWISAAMGGYGESRMVVGEVVQSGETTVIECRGICCSPPEERWMQLVGDLKEVGGRTMGRIDDVSDLRTNPIGLSVSRGETQWQLLRHLMPELDQVWVSIERGVDLQNHEETRAHVLEVMAEIGWRGMGATRVSVRGSIYLGAEIERRMAQRGVKVMAGGSHGGSNTSAMDRMGAFGRIFEMSASVHSEAKSDKLELCPSCQRYFLKKNGGCRNCGSAN